MVNKEMLQNRLMGLNKAIEQSLANHNALLGRKAECEDTINEIKNLEAQVAQEQAQVAVEQQVPAAK